jgi:hypothetical protein
MPHVVPESRHGRCVVGVCLRAHIGHSTSHVDDKRAVLLHRAEDLLTERRKARGHRRSGWNAQVVTFLHDTRPAAAVARDGAAGKSRLDQRGIDHELQGVIDRAAVGLSLDQQPAQLACPDCRRASTEEG